MLSSLAARRQHFGSKCGPLPRGERDRERDGEKITLSPVAGERAALRAETLASSDEARAE